MNNEESKIGQQQELGHYNDNDYRLVNMVNFQYDQEDIPQI